MNRLGPGLAALCILAFVSGSAAFRIPATGTTATTCWAPPEPDPTITVACFGPSRVAQLERRMPALIDPSVTVRRTTHLLLTDAILLTRHGRPLLASFLYGDLRYSRPPFPSKPRYLSIDEFPDGRYQAYAHRLRVGRQTGGLVQVKGYVPTRSLSFRVSAFAAIAALRTIAQAVVRAGSHMRSAGEEVPSSM